MDQHRGTIIITGGSKGIGLSIARVFARETSHPILLIARDKSELEQAQSTCREEGAGKVDILSADITDPGFSNLDLAAFKPSVLVNNAGSFLFKPLGDTSSEEFTQQFRVNALGAFHVTNAVLPHFKRQGRGLIVNICSEGSLKGLPESGAYSASKHATLGYTRSLREELKGSGIAVSAINLGQTYSTSWDGVDIDPEKLIDPEDVGRLILSLSTLSVRTVVEEILIQPEGGQVPPM